MAPRIVLNLVLVGVAVWVLDRVVAEYRVAVSSSAPASIFTAGGVRYRLYAGLGLTASVVAVTVGVNRATYYSCRWSSGASGDILGLGRKPVRVDS